MKTISAILLLLLAVQMAGMCRLTTENGEEIVGVYGGKLEGDIYVIIDDIVYKIPISKITKIEASNKEVNIDGEDKLHIDLSKYPVRNYVTSKGLLAMSEREFEIYKLNDKQKQADKVAAEIRKLNNTVITISIIGLAAGVVMVIMAN